MIPFLFEMNNDYGNGEQFKKQKSYNLVDESLIEYEVLEDDDQDLEE
jgi:hypothetical protein